MSISITPWLPTDAQIKHATMALAGWRFQCTADHYWQMPKYFAINPQGEVVSVRSTLMLCVNEAWDRWVQVQEAA